ncbi:hypothetical protein [Flavobacterium sp.]|uniref:hypothetical protein n=1 Tax=Flavobacterium sp. TaxID=239 RepID=UPI0037503F32
MKNLFNFVLLFFTTSIFAQETITSEQAKDNIGKVVIIKGKIASLKLASEGKNINFINIDKAYPNKVFTVVLTNKYLEEHKLDIANSVGKEIIVKGKITIYDKDPKKIPQIFNPSELEIK